MRLITIKKLALVASAGVLFQLLGAGCGGLLFQLIANTVLNGVVSAILNNITNGGTGTEVTPTP